MPFSPIRPCTPHAAGLQIWGLRQTRPLTYFTFWLNYQMGGEDPLGYHLLNLALHLGAVAAGLRMPAPAAARACRGDRGGDFRGASDSGGSGGLRLGAQHRAGDAALPGGAAGSGSTAGEWIAVAWFAAALLAKEEVAAFPLVLLAGSNRQGSRGSPAHRAMLALSVAAGARVIYATA